MARRYPTFEVPARARRDEWGDYVREHGLPRRGEDQYERLGWPLKPEAVELWPGGEVRRPGKRPY
jgi:hypothetical protein